MSRFIHIEPELLNTDHIVSVTNMENGRVEIELVLEPALSLFLDVRTALLYRMASLFLRVWSCRTRNRCRADLLAVMPWPARA